MWLKHAGLPDLCTYDVTRYGQDEWSVGDLLVLRGTGRPAHAVRLAVGCWQSASGRQVWVSEQAMPGAWCIPAHQLEQLDLSAA